MLLRRNKRKKELRFGNEKLKDLISFLKAYDDEFYITFEKGFNNKNAEEAIYKFREKLMEYPDIYVPIKRIPRFGSWEETELFYIPDIAFMANVLIETGYLAFLHELYDFLYFKVLEENPQELYIALPITVKNALIDLIDREEKRKVVSQ